MPAAQFRSTVIASAIECRKKTDFEWQTVIFELFRTETRPGCSSPRWRARNSLGLIALAVIEENIRQISERPEIGVSHLPARTVTVAATEA